MAFDVIDADQRLTGNVSQGLRITQADKQRADQAGPLRNGYPVNRRESGTRFRKRGIDHIGDVVEMFSGGKFRDYAAKRRVSVDLRSDDIRADDATLVDHG